MVGVDPDTLAVYDTRAEEYAETRPPRRPDRPRRLAAAALDGLPVADLGCGPGGYLGELAGPAERAVVGFDAAPGMLALARSTHPETPLVRADLGALPVRRHGLGGAWARHSYFHLPHADLPLALHELHRVLAVGAPVMISMLTGEGSIVADDDLPGRRFWLWEADPLTDALVGAGFEDVTVEVDGEAIYAWARRARSLADTVGPGMRLLCVGLNPSVVAADAGVAFWRRGNRFWPALLAAGLASRDRDPVHALTAHGVGMTDLVKRATARSFELEPAEYEAGLGRIERLASTLQPGVVAFVGLEGYRAAVDRKAVPGFQTRLLGGRPTYVLPSTSGVNGHVSLADLTDHLRAAAAGPAPAPL